MPKWKNRRMKILKIVHLLWASCWLGGAAPMLVLNLGAHSAIFAKIRQIYEIYPLVMR